MKNDERTSHVPIILLTAKADLESRITGLQRGADAYLAKPFHQEELLLTVANALASRKSPARFADAAAATSSDLSPTPVQDVEDAFVQKVRAAVEAHLSDASFSVDQLCRALAMSQPQPAPQTHRADRQKRHPVYARYSPGKSESAVAAKKKP